MINSLPLRLIISMVVLRGEVGVHQVKVTMALVYFLIGHVKLILFHALSVNFLVRYLRLTDDATQMWDESDVSCLHLSETEFIANARY